MRTSHGLADERARRFLPNTSDLASSPAPGGDLSDPVVSPTSPAYLSPRRRSPGEDREERMGNGSAAVASTALAVHSLCGLGLAAGYWLARGVDASPLVADPERTLRRLLAVEAPVVMGAYSLVRSDAGRCSYWRALGRGLIGLPVGALLNAFGAIVLGAPFWIEYLTKTITWSLLMSLFTFAPAVCVYGSSRKDWHRILALSQITGVVDYMVSLPAHGAVIGAWVGAWPMPLDWERPWQEWPICVTYGAIAGYLLGILASLAFIVGREAHAKGD